MLNYFKETVAELKKLAIPTKKEIYITTITITAVITIFSLVVMFCDFAIAKVIALVFGL